MDSLRGEDGNDVLYGGSGNDTLVGGSGDDHFHFNGNNSNEGADVISDYNATNDTLRIDDGDYVSSASKNGASELVIALSGGGSVTLSGYTGNSVGYEYWDSGSSTWAVGSVSTS